MIADIGPEPQAFDLERETINNSNYRSVGWSGRYLQLSMMSIPPGSDIGLEKHAETDQFLRLDGGRGRVQMGPQKNELTFDSRSVRRLVRACACWDLAQHYQCWPRSHAAVHHLRAGASQARDDTQHGRRCWRRLG
jgi:hypothetical protein